MVRITSLTIVDQALLSGLNFALAIVVIRYAGQSEYGLYAQLIALQSLLSPVHAGVFVSAYVALAPRADAHRAAIYRAGMARAELVLSPGAAAATGALTYLGARIAGTPLSTPLVGAASLALLGLWWREFTRQVQFVRLEYTRAISIDVAYLLITATAVAAAIVAGAVDSVSILCCMGAGGVLAAAWPLLRAAGSTRMDASGIRRELAESWRVGQWDALGSVVAWGAGQSYVYFAAAQGGRGAAAEIAAGRLLATPLALLWAAYANVLRPKASLALAEGRVHEVRQLAQRSALFVLACSAGYALLLYVLLPLAGRTIFHGGFQHLAVIALLWTAYTTLAGLTTIAANLLRCALRFRMVFWWQLIGCLCALVLMTVCARKAETHLLVVALLVTELLMAVQLWRQLTRLFRPDSGATAKAIVP
jgi:O-antigen/teichoic acid export membrane protein